MPKRKGPKRQGLHKEPITAREAAKALKAEFVRLRRKKGKETTRWDRIQAAQKVLGKAGAEPARKVAEKTRDLLLSTERAKKLAKMGRVATAVSILNELEAFRESHGILERFSAGALALRSKDKMDKALHLWLSMLASEQAAVEKKRSIHKWPIRFLMLETLDNIATLAHKTGNEQLRADAVKDSEYILNLLRKRMR